LSDGEIVWQSGRMISFCETNRSQSGMGGPTLPDERPLLMMLYSQVFCRVEALIKPMDPPIQITAYPLSIRELETALRRCLPECQEIDAGAHSDRTLEDVEPHQTVVLGRYAGNEKLEKLYRRIDSLKILIATFEKENAELNVQIESLTGSHPAVFALRQRIAGEGEQITNSERALDELHKEHALVISRERGQLNSIAQSVNCLSSELSLLQRRLEVIARGRAPAEPLNGVPKVPIVRPPPLPASKSFRRKRVLFRKPEPAKPPPDSEPQLIPVRCAHLWATDEELQCLGGEATVDEEEDVNLSMMWDDCDVPADQPPVEFGPALLNVTWPDIDVEEGSPIARPPPGDSREADGGNPVQRATPWRMRVSAPGHDRVTGAVDDIDQPVPEEDEEDGEYAPFRFGFAHDTDGCSDEWESDVVVLPFSEDPPPETMDCGPGGEAPSESSPCGAEEDANAPACGLSGRDAPVEETTGTVLEPQARAPPRARRSFAIQTCIVTSHQPDNDA
jgi:hypothetical protein